MRSAATYRPGRRRLATLLTAAVLAAPAAAPAARVVAIGDVHGAYDELRQILRAAGLTDAEDRWIGGETRLVQTGDFTDRGSRVREVMDLLRRLQREAPASGGEVVVLLGNHEMLNLIRDTRDVASNPELCARFTDERSAERREAAWKGWREWRDRQQRRRGELDAEEEAKLDEPLRRFLEQSRDQWMASHPAGLVEYQRALAPDGEYGRWLRGLSTAVRVDDTLFLHGGISPELGVSTLEELDRLHREEIDAADRAWRRLEDRGQILPWFSWVETRLALKYEILVPTGDRQRSLAVEAWTRFDALVDRIGSADSPLWYRGYSLPPKGLADVELEALLDRTEAEYGVHRVVAAHSPLDDAKILTRLEGRLFLIDTGMLTSHYGGGPSALEIDGDRVRAIYPDRVTVLVPAPSRAARQPAADPAGVHRRPGADGEPLPPRTVDKVDEVHFDYDPEPGNGAP